MHHRNFQRMINACLTVLAVRHCARYLFASYRQPLDFFQLLQPTAATAVATPCFEAMPVLFYNAVIQGRPIVE